MKSIKFLEGLRERKNELMAEIAAACKPQAEELAMIDQLLAKHTNGQQPHLFVEASMLKGHNESGKHVFLPDPNSHTTRVVNEARRVLEASSRREMSFLRLYHEFAPELNGSGKARERARIALQRAGKRAGVEYVSKDKVRLIG